MHTSTQNTRPSFPAAATTTPFLAPRSTDTRSNPPSRWSLTLQARIWRFLARIGFYLHTFPKPSPPTPSFLRYFTTTALDSTNPATLELAFYVPADYNRQTQRGKRYPVVVNYHGGGFTMGRTSDDARWAAMVVREVSAVVVGVAYRLAPEHPFPTAVEDGVCAVLYLSANAETLGIDAGKISLSGFSAGGNLAFTIPLRLQTHLRILAQEREEQDVPPFPHIVSIIAWYPSLDNRLTRTQRRAASLNPSKALPSLLTNLFDASYLPSQASVTSPYASPAAATDEALITALPDNIALYLCEWDMLLQEGKDFGERLKELGKRVRCEVIKERRHAFDKSPWPFGLDWKVEVCYRQACGWLCEVFGEL
ncbi:MAG: hypothetical protein M1830_008285 [Pleopsidium flavum]|nr:MAG: hypothetical protein M1830_008285 [Pleopsidium flavum]